MPYGTVNADIIQSSVSGVSLGAGNASIMKNRIINGAMVISQRAAVNTAVAVSNGGAGTYGPDRFYGYSGTLSLWNIYQVTTSAYDFPYAFRTQRIAGQTSTSACYFGQTIETNNCIDLAGQSVTLSFYATAGANYSGGAATVQILTGTVADEGTLSLNAGTWTGIALPINTTFTPTATRTKFTFTATLGSTVKEVAFRFNWSGSGTAGANDYIDITGVQLEVGSSATGFEYEAYSSLLNKCQRYYEKCYPIGTVAGSFTVDNGVAYRDYTGVSQTFAGTIMYKVVKRATPTFTYYDAAGTAGAMTYYSSGWTNGGTLSPVAPTDTQVIFQSSGAFTGIQFGWTTSAEL